MHVLVILLNKFLYFPLDDFSVSVHRSEVRNHQSPYSKLATLLNDHDLAEELYNYTSQNYCMICKFINTLYKAI